MAGKFEILKNSSGKYHFNLKAGNGQVILTSQSYDSKESAMKGTESVKNNASDDSRFERKKDKNGDPYFVLKATNGQDIGRSEMYSSEAGMESGISSVKNNAPNAEVVDTTGA